MRGKTFVYISSWAKSSDGSGDFGLRGYEFNRETGELRLLETVEGNHLFNVTCFDRRRGILYALNEENELPGLRAGGGGRVFAFRIDPGKGTLTKISCKETWCPSPSYLALDKTGKFVIVSNHGSKAAVTKIGQDPFGNYYPVVEHDDVAVELFSVCDDGRIDRLLDVVKHRGSGPEKRQVIARPHSVVMSPSGRLFAVCDKGNDTVRMYGLDEERGKLLPPGHIYRHTPGTLPRYCVFHPEKPWFYHNNENCTNFHAFRYEEDGFLQEMGTCGVVPADAEMRETPLEQQGLAIDRTGRYIYNITRGPNIVTVLEVNQQDGSIRPVQHQPIPGKWPRGCAISPDGRFLLVCCRDSEEIVEFSIGADGLLCGGSSKYCNRAAAYAVFCEFS